MDTRETTLLESASAEDSFAAIGDVLRVARVDRRLALDEVAQSLRYSKNYIRYLEDGDFDLLPGSTYVAGYLRSYAQLLEIDGPSLIARYQRLLNPVEMRPKYNFPIPGQRPQRSGAVVASFIVIIAVAGYVGWYLAEKPGFDVLAPEQETAQLEGTTPLATPTTEILSKGDGAVVANVASDVVLATDVVTVGEPVSNTELNGQVDEPVSELLSSVVEVAAPTLDEPAPIAPVETAPVEVVSKVETSVDNELGPVVDTADPGSANAKVRDETQDITLRAVASSWVDIVRNNGEEVMTKLMRNGDTYIIDGGENLYLSTGNAGGLEFVLNDGTILSAGEVGEILRDLPLKSSDLLDNL